MAAAEATAEWKAKVVTEEREDLLLGVESRDCADITDSFSCNHACFCMCLSCVARKAFQGQLLPKKKKKMMIYMILNMMIKRMRILYMIRTPCGRSHHDNRDD